MSAALTSAAPASEQRRSLGRYALVLIAELAVVSASLAFISTPVLARGAAVAGAYLVLALSEVVPPFVPTLLLLVATPLALGPLDARYQLGPVLAWPADAVMALFAGGLSLGLAAERHGIDTLLANQIVRLARGRCLTLLGLVLSGTALLSMWMSNVAAAAMVFAALRPLRQQARLDPGFSRALLLAVAIGANVGGMATPIGTGPNAIAIAAVEQQHPITFIAWMSFALPLVLGILACAYALLALRYGVRGGFRPLPSARLEVSRAARAVMLVFGAAVAAWLSEPLHGVPAALVALGVTTILFLSGLLSKADLGALDWPTLGLIAGGISLGKLLEQTGLVAAFARIDWGAMPDTAWLAALVCSSALLSAVMSNTATAALLIPLGLSIDASAATAVLIAIGASFGMPFAISTPPNAMAYGEGLSARDLLWIGLAILVIGCVLVTFTGRAVLGAMGLP